MLEQHVFLDYSYTNLRHLVPVCKVWSIVPMRARCEEKSRVHCMNSREHADPTPAMSVLVWTAIGSFPSAGSWSENNETVPPAYAR